MLFTPMLHEVAGSDVGVTDIVQPLQKMLRIRGWRSPMSRRLISPGNRFNPSPRPAGCLRGNLRSGCVGAWCCDELLSHARLGGARVHDEDSGRRDACAQSYHRLAELADNQPDETRRRTTLTVVVAGGGFAGVETVGAVNDFLREGMKLYPHLKEGMIRVVLVHPGEVILPELGESLGRYAQKKLTERAVEILLNRKVSSFDGESVMLDDGAKIDTRMLIWTAGTTPAPVVSSLPCKLPGPRRRRRISASARFPGCLDAGRLRAHSRPTESWQVLSTDRAACDPSSGRARREHRRSLAR